MADYTIFIIGCFLLAGIMIEVMWTAFSYTMQKLEYFFYHRYLDKVSRDVMMEYMENPVAMTNERGEKYWVGYKK